MALRKTTVCLLGIFFLSSCASYFKRKECEKTNWYQYGHSIAMKGKRLDDENFVRTCEKVEAEIDYAKLDVGFKSGMANYCLPEIVYKEGREGRFFNFEMCHEQIKLLKKKHAEGVVQFCKPSSGYRAAAKGWIYNGICPKKYEITFMPKYYKGRKVYLSGMITDKNQEIRDLDRKIRQLDREKRDVRYQLSRLPRNKTVTRTRVYDRSTGQMREEVNVAENDEAQRRRNSLQHQLSKLGSNASRARKKQTQLRNEIQTLKTELRSLGNEKEEKGT